MRSILILRPGALGDAVLTLPLIEALVTAGVERIALLGAPPSWAFLAASTGPVEVLDLDGRDWLGLFGEGAALAPRARRVLGEMDAAFVFLGRGRAPVERALVAAGVGRVVSAAPAVLGETSAEPLPAGPPHAILAPWPPHAAHAARRLFAPLAASGQGGAKLPWPPAPLPLAEHPLLRPTREEIERVRQALDLGALPAGGILALHPGSGGAAKCWPAERFATLAGASAERFGLVPVWLVGPADEAPWRRIAAALQRSGAPRVLLERPLREVLALLSLARAYVGNDSGVTHLAARACPTLALFGPSDPRVWHPLGPRVAILNAEGGDLARLAPERALEALARLA